MTHYHHLCPEERAIVMQRGNNRQTLFTSDSDIAAYAHWLSEGAARYQVQIQGWVFMTNHASYGVRVKGQSKKNKGSKK